MSFNIFIIFSLFIGINCLTGPFTEDFRLWLESAGYADYNFPSLHLGINASYGGKEYKEQELKRNPVIFIHGNSDGALDDGTEFSSGFTASIRHFLSNGYTSGELYAITWGDRKLAKSFNREHTCATLLRIRRFVEAVLTYTNSTKIDIIAHSMGVTLARQIIKGGIIRDNIEACMIGKPINHQIHTFVGIAAANYGLCSCNKETAAKMPACGVLTGFYSGETCRKHFKMPLTKHHKSHVSCSEAEPDHDCNPEYATNLMKLNSDKSFKDAQNVYSFWSEEDEIIGSNGVWGRKTSEIPNSDDVIVYRNKKHHALKTETVKDQYRAIVYGLY
jgi:triacylglycerol lipase